MTTISELPNGGDADPADLLEIQRDDESLFVHVSALPATPIPAQPVDSGWQDVVLRSGFSPQSTNERPRVRRIGPMVWLRGLVSNAAGEFPVNTNTTYADLPAGFAPPADGGNIIVRAGTSNGNQSASLFVSTNGDLTLRVGDDASAYYAGIASWLLNDAYPGPAIAEGT